MSERLADHIAGGTISGPNGTYWNLQRDDAENIIDALLPYLTAEDVPHLIRQAKAEAWDEGYSSGVNDARIADSTPIDFGFGETYIEPCRANPYAEEADHE